MSVHQATVASQCQVFAHRNRQESANERPELGQRRRKCPQQAYRQDAVWQNSSSPADQAAATTTSAAVVSDGKTVQLSPPDHAVERPPEPETATATVTTIVADPVPEPVTESVSPPSPSVASVQRKENLVLNLNNGGTSGGGGVSNGRHQRRSSSVVSSTTTTATSVCPDTEYRQEFRCKGFRGHGHGGRGRSTSGQRQEAGRPAAGRPSAPLHHHLVMNTAAAAAMTRSATADGIRPASPVAPSGDGRRRTRDEHDQQAEHRSHSVSEYKTKFKEFDAYVYVDDMRMFQRKKSQEEGEGYAEGDRVDGGRSLTWFVRMHHFLLPLCPLLLMHLSPLSLVSVRLARIVGWIRCGNVTRRPCPFAGDPSPGTVPPSHPPARCPACTGSTSSPSPGTAPWPHSPSPPRDSSSTTSGRRDHVT